MLVRNGCAAQCLQLPLKAKKDVSLLLILRSVFLDMNCTRLLVNRHS